MKVGGQKVQFNKTKCIFARIKQNMEYIFIGKKRHLNQKHISISTIYSS
jgi:hypothetical protein